MSVIPESAEFRRPADLASPESALLEVAIRVESLSKSYRIGETPERVRIVRDFVGPGCIVVGEVAQALNGSLGLAHAFAGPGHSPRGAERES